MAKLGPNSVELRQSGRRPPHLSTVRAVAWATQPVYRLAFRASGLVGKTSCRGSAAVGESMRTGPNFGRLGGPKAADTGAYLVNSRHSLTEHVQILPNRALDLIEPSPGWVERGAQVGPSRAEDRCRTECPASGRRRRSICSNRTKFGFRRKLRRLWRPTFCSHASAPHACLGMMDRAVHVMRRRGRQPHFVRLRPRIPASVPPSACTYSCLSCCSMPHDTHGLDVSLDSSHGYL